MNWLCKYIVILQTIVRMVLRGSAGWLTPKSMYIYCREEMGGGWGFFTHIEPTVTDPSRIVPCQYHCWGMPGRQAGSPIAVYARVQCREPKTGQKKVQFYCEDDWLWPSCYYLSTVWLTPTETRILYILYIYTYIYTYIIYTIYIHIHIYIYIHIYILYYTYYTKKRKKKNVHKKR